MAVSQGILDEKPQRVHPDPSNTRQRLRSGWQAGWNITVMVPERICTLNRVRLEIWGICLKDPLRPNIKTKFHTCR
tara:strand:- start:789 stop:1016 length:228 start_codon:yes stop_codon:yes gene_type:complete